MRRFTVFAAIVAIAAAAAVPGAAQGTGLSAAQILDKVDDAINGPKDQSYNVRLVLIDKRRKGKDA